jgi:hypothetical protein
LNPELRRNLWLQFSVIRLILAPIVIGAILALTWLVDERQPTGVAQVAEAIYLLLVLLWGTRRAADLVAEEIAGGTWDGQRMSALGALQMSWGKLLGGTSYIWYCAGLAFIAHLVAQWLGGIAPWTSGAWIRLLHLLGAGALAQAVAMLVSLALLRRQAARRRLGVTLSQIAGILAGIAASGQLDGSLLYPMSSEVVWYGWVWDGARFSLASLALFLAWSIFGIYRLMRVELKFRSGPAAWLAFTLFLMIYGDGFLYRPIMIAGGALGAWLILPFLLAAGLTYLAVFLEPKDVMRYRWLLAALAAGDLRQAWSLLPQWLPVYLLALSSALVLSASADLTDLGHRLLSGPFVSAGELAHAPDLAFYPLAVAIYLLRDLLLVLYCNFGRGRQRGDATAFILLFVAYGPLTGILSSLGMSTVIPLLAPYPLAPPFFNFAAALVETAAMAALVHSRLARAGRFSPAVA